MRVNLSEVAYAMRQAIGNATTLSPSDVNAIVGKGVETLIDNIQDDEIALLRRKQVDRRLVFLDSQGLITDVEYPTTPPDFVVPIEDVKPDPSFNVRSVAPYALTNPAVRQLADSIKDGGLSSRLNVRRNGHPPIPKDEV